MEVNLDIANLTKIMLKQVLEESSCNAAALKVMKSPLLELDNEAFEFFIKQNIAKTSQNNEEQQKFQKNSAFDVLHHLCNEEFQNILHMTKTTYLTLFRFMQEPLLSIEISTQVKLQQIYAISLWKLITNASYAELSQRFSLQPNLSALIVRNFCAAIAERFMPWPNSYQTQLETLRSFSNDIMQKFPGLFGIVNVKRLQVLLETQDTKLPIVLQLICKGNKHIIDCCVELEQNYSFEQTPIGQMLAISKKTLPLNSYLVGETNCPLKKYLLRPFAAEENLFNCSLALPLSLAEQVYDLLSKRFGILQNLTAANLTDLRSIIETICSLHNLCIDSNDKCLQAMPSAAHNYQFQASETDAEGQAARLRIMQHLIATT